MPLNLNISIDEKEAKDFIDFYIEKQRNIKNQMTVLGAELKAINARITELKQGLQEIGNTIDQSDYSSKWHWVKKIEFAINKAGKPLTTNEIVDILTDYQPEYISGRRSAIASVSATLSSKSGSYSQHKEFVKIIADWGGQAYDVWRERIDVIPDPIDDDIDFEIDTSKVVNSEPADDFPF